MSPNPYLSKRTQKLREEKLQELLEPCPHEIPRAGHHPDQPSICRECGEEL